ncbi:hypothetical protein [Aliarcobacter butzleri]|uniref:hypothetical protein n=1 Tax=Aliarcobacter butzleri TaxID=28197 RepID=UPI003AF49343
MKKILIIGDSSIPPREEVDYSAIYSTLVKNTLIDFKIEVSAKTGNHSGQIDINLDAFMLYGYNPNIVILNYGIVDVFPRPYPNKFYKLMVCIGLLKYIDKFLKKTKLYYKLGDYFNFKEVSLEKFEENSKNIIKKLLEKNVEKIIIIGIIKPYKILLNSKNIHREVELYNNVFLKLSQKYHEVKYIDIYNDSTEDFTIWDGYHYSKIASKYLADKIEELIKND